MENQELAMNSRVIINSVIECVMSFCVRYNYVYGSIKSIEYLGLVFK